MRFYLNTIVLMVMMEYKNIKLGKWLQNQKSSYKGYKGRKKLTEEQIIKLEKLNIKFK